MHLKTVPNTYKQDLEFGINIECPRGQQGVAFGQCPVAPAVAVGGAAAGARRGSSRRSSASMSGTGRETQLNWWMAAVRGPGFSLSLMQKLLRTNI
jgi:hypothetical protein